MKVSFYGFYVAVFLFACGFVELLCRGLFTFTTSFIGWVVALRALISSAAFAFFWQGFVFLFGRKSKFILLPVLGFAVLNTIIEVFVLVRCRRRLGGGWYSLLATSSIEEIYSFLMSNIEIVAGGIAAIFFMSFVVWKYYKMHVTKPSTSLRLCGGGLLLMATAIILVCVKCYNGFSPPAYIGFLPSTIMSIQAFERGRFLLRSKAPETIRSIEQHAALPVCLFVIGESACRSHWSIYGYERDTNPEISRWRNELGIFTDVQTVYPYTEQSMNAICVAHTDQQGGVCTLAGLCKAAGYKCALVSGQGRFKSIDMGDSLTFYGVDESVFITDGHTDSLVYDDAILPCVQSLLGKYADMPAVIFIHLYGSHFPFELRCPQSKRYFTEEKKGHFVNAYDDSLRFTDSILGRLLDLLEREKRPSVFIYLSDHGESPDSGRTRVITDKDCWQVPMVVWLSRSYRARFPEVAARLSNAVNRPLQNDCLLPGILEILRITGMHYKKADSFLDDEFKCQTRVVEF